ncbi:MAG: His/Gly/Thr/Pro-type tRNA ligase C-terminal domain-containing protein, partial [Candidatus Bathyarchaeota archaeon]|nr:His/Gly/Thr/Pro-type tRNA ligase C-terminal domain-containing protein [Candidatus Bathyarchaeota archaeon]
ELEMAVGAGGRYDELVQEFGGDAVPATGFAIGVDRCIDSLKRQKYPFPSRPPSKVFVLAITDELERDGIRIASLLRGAGIPAETNVSNWDLSRGLSYAGRVGIPYAVILGEKELKRASVIVRDMKLGEQKEVKIRELLSFFENEETLKERV